MPIARRRETNIERVRRRAAERRLGRRKDGARKAVPKRAATLRETAGERHQALQEKILAAIREAKGDRKKAAGMLGYKNVKVLRSIITRRKLSGKVKEIEKELTAPVPVLDTKTGRPLVKTGRPMMQHAQVAPGVKLDVTNFYREERKQLRLLRAR